MEKLFILETLEDTGWKIEGKRGAAKSLGLKPSTLRNRMKRLDIRRPASPF
jgi:transcriptional regulator with GAF, ATPase, and Fis domain